MKSGVERAQNGAPGVSASRRSWQFATNGSTCAIIGGMTTVGLRELRQNASDLVRRVEDGEEIEITVAGRLAARLVPAAPRRWQRWVDIADLFAGRPDPDWDRDRDLIDQSVANPWEHDDEGNS